MEWGVIMRIIAVDDETRPLNLIRIMLEKIDGVELVASFSNPVDAYEYLRHVSVDMAFVDVEMPEINGLEFAKMLEKLADPPQVVFVTAYPQYAVEAWKTIAEDYILKPYGIEQLKNAINRVSKRINKHIKGYEVRCFPRFDLLVNGKPLVFRSKRGKELLAYLVHYQGSWVSVGSLVFDLFGDKDEQASKSHYRVILSRLKQDLSGAGLSEILHTGYGKIRVEIPPEACDYYRYLRGSTDLFSGEYLQEYSWAETEATRIKMNINLSSSRRRQDERDS